MLDFFFIKVVEIFYSFKKHSFLYQDELVTKIISLKKSEVHDV